MVEMSKCSLYSFSGMHTVYLNQGRGEELATLIHLNIPAHLIIDISSNTRQSFSFLQNISFLTTAKGYPIQAAILNNMFKKFKVCYFPSIIKVT